MKENIREEERKIIEIILEQKALEKVLSLMKSTVSKPEIEKIQKFDRFIHSKKHVRNKYIQNDTNQWISKHKSLNGLKTRNDDLSIRINFNK